MLLVMYNYLLSYFNDEEGQGMVEYALIIGLIAIVVIGVLTTLGGGIAASFDRIVQALTPAAN